MSALSEPKESVLTELDVCRGLNMADNPHTLAAGTLTDARNVRAEGGRLRKRAGYATIKANGTADRVRLAASFVDSGGTRRLCACTHDTIFGYVPASNTFESEGTFSDATDTPRYDADTWGYILYLCKLGGDVWKWDGTTGAPGAHATDVSASFPSITCLRRFNSRFVGGVLPRSVYWSAPDLPEDWAGAGSGNEPRPTLQGDVMALEPVGRGLAVWSEESIDMMAEGADPVSAPFAFLPAEPKLGTPAPHSVCKIGAPYTGMAVFLGSDLNIHVFNGIRAQSVADAIHPFLKGVVERDYLQKAWGQVWEEHGIYLLALPAAGSSENNLVVEWQYRAGRLYLHELSGTNKAWTAGCRWIKAAPLTWAQRRALGTTWAQGRASGLRWGEARKATGRREVGFLGASGDLVGLFEGTRDGTAPITSYGQFAPMDGGSPNVKEVSRVEILDDRLGGQSTLSVIVGRSMDGASYLTRSFPHLLVPTTDPFIDWREAGRYFTLRIVNAPAAATPDEMFSLKGFRLWGQATGEER